MGAQQAKERGTASGASMRSARSKPRVPKDPRILGSNIFTEHSGESHYSGDFSSSPHLLLSRNYCRFISLFTTKTFCFKIFHQFLFD
jgi:hypothetical protein